MKAITFIALFFYSFITMPVNAQLTGPVDAAKFPNSPLLLQLLQQQSALLSPVLNQPQKFHLQIIYTQINRDKRNRPSFEHHFYNVTNQYNYPASTVKLPAAVLALEKVNTLAELGVTRNSVLITRGVRPGETDVLYDTSNLGGRPTVANYVKKIALVSDNDAFNRLYELIGQEAFNNRLHALGFTDAQILHRLEMTLTEAENRQTNPVEFRHSDGQVLWQQPAQMSNLTYAIRNDRLGNGFMRNGQLINEPLDFNKKNRWPLPYIHQLIQWIMFPETQPTDNKLQLTADDYRFLQTHISMWPQESKHPNYSGPEYWPAYVKFLLYGSDPKASLLPTVRIFNKVGDAYGFLLDGAYIADVEKGIEFMLSAVVYCNEDGILNDNHYDYDNIGFPFMKHLGQVIFDYEKSRSKPYKPDLSAFRFHYLPQ